jgi:hypothetical protein
MDQNSYNLIMSCIQYGAPAVAPQLIQALNTVVEKANQFVELQRIKLEEQRKAEEAKKDAEMKAKADKEVPKK